MCVCVYNLLLNVRVSIRLFIDPKPLNKALKRNRYPLLTIDDLLAKLTNAKVFTVVDTKNRFLARTTR